jgi:hypothetical protein
LNQGGKLENLKKEMQKNAVSVLGVSEVRWKGQGEIRSGNYTVCYSGGDRAERGVAIVVHKSIVKSVVKKSAMKCESGNVEVQWNNIKKCVLDTTSDLVGGVERRAIKPWITQEIISKMDKRRKWKNVNNEEGRKNYRRLRKELKRATDNAKIEYIESIWNLKLK